MKIADVFLRSARSVPAVAALTLLLFGTTSLAFAQLFLLTQTTSLFSGSGNVIFESGAWNSAGEIVDLDRPWEVHHQTINRADQVQVYEDVMLDLNGNAMFTFLRAASYAKDNRLLPRGFSSAVSYYDTVAIFGEAASDPDFNRDASGEGTGADVVHYRLPACAPVMVELYCQSVHPRVTEYFRRYNAAEIMLFDSLYAEQSSATLILATVTAVPTILRLSAIVEGDSLPLSWQAIPGALSYSVYAAGTADAIVGDLLGMTTDTNYRLPASDSKRFFWITANQ